MSSIKQFNLYEMTRNFYRLFFFIICLFVSSYIYMTTPYMPAHDLDSSWVFSINEAAIQKMAFGKDIIFSYGPYVSIRTNFYNPDNFYIITIGSLYLTLTFAYALFLNFNNSHCIVHFTILFIIFLSPMKESAFLFLPILSFNYIYNNFEQNKRYIINTFILLLHLGLLPLIKGTFIIICLIIVSTLFVSFIIKYRRNYLSFFMVFTPFASCCLLWILSGQEFYNIFLYFKSMIPIISGYTEAMNGHVGKNIYLYIYIIISIIILYQFYRITGDNYLIFICFTTLFLAFKEGFVRYDAHALIAFGFIILMSISLFAKKVENIIVIFILILSFLSFVNLNMYFLNHLGIKNTNNIVEYTQKHILQNSINRVKLLVPHLSMIFSCNFDSWDKSHQRSILAIKANYPLPLLPGTSDIYSYNQTDLLASGNIWNPRPVFQSYSAYTKELLEKNRNHLLSNNRPDNIFFRLQTFDNRYPSLDDGFSWPTMADNYKLVSVNNDLAILKRNDKIIYKSNMRTIVTMQHKSLDLVTLHQTELPLFVKIHIKPTLLGRIANIILNAPIVKITIVCKNGNEYIKRLIPEIAASGFFLSPFVQNTFEFAELISGNHELLSDNQVVSLSIKLNKAFYKSKYTLELLEFQYNGEKTDASQFTNRLY